VVRCTSGSHGWKNEKLSRHFMRSKMHGLRPLLYSFDTWTRALLYIAVASSITIGCIKHWWLLVLATVLSWGIYLGCRIFVFHRVARELGERRYNVSIPLLDIIHPLWELYFALRMRLSSKDMHMRRKV
jgi:hypothetical protein